MKYKIGMVAKLLGMSASGVRLYENSGIVKAKRDENEKNNYRFYEYLDITAMMRARGYHNLGFSTKEIGEMLNTDNYNSVIDNYKKRQKELEEEIKVKNMQLEYLKKLEKLTSELENDLWKISFRIRPAMYRFKYGNGDRLTMNKNQYKQFQEWIKLEPFVFPSQSNKWTKVINGEKAVSSSLGIEKKYAEIFNLNVKENTKFYDECECLYTVVKEKGEGFNPVKCLMHLKNYVEENGLIVTGDPIARTVLAINKNNNYTRYRQVWLPIVK